MYFELKVYLDSYWNLTCIERFWKCIFFKTASFQKLSSKPSNEQGQKPKSAAPQLKLGKLLAPISQQVEDIEHMYIPPPSDAGKNYSTSQWHR